MKQGLIGVSLFLLLILSSAELPAQGLGRDPRSDSSFMASREVSLIKELNMTDAQVKETRRIRAVYSNRILKLKSDIIGKHIEFRHLLRDPATSEDVLRSKGKEIEAIDAQLIREMTEMEIDLRKVLTPEQLQRLATMDQQQSVKKPGLR